ncbi:hypothetical protein J4419_06210 [Candidatus Woesearchaeota archaeon]|nr:hypothetical protein [Candidatus Woesearchaeota archaeon]
MKCDLCGAKIQQTFLNKILGTQIRVNGKKKLVCFECQRKFPKKEDLLKQLS